MNEKELWQKYKSSMSIKEKCPSYNDLAAYIEMRLDPEDRERVESHLAGCTSCLDTVIMLKQAKNGYSDLLQAKCTPNLPFANIAKPANSSFVKTSLSLAAASVIFVLVSYFGLSAGAGTYMSSASASELFLEKDLRLLASDFSSENLLDFDFGEIK